MAGETVRGTRGIEGVDLSIGTGGVLLAGCQWGRQDHDDSTLPGFIEPTAGSAQIKGMEVRDHGLATSVAWPISRKSNIVSESQRTRKLGVLYDLGRH